jgi:indole-3-glycerol phosphate synthase
MSAPQVFIPTPAAGVPDILARILADKQEEVRARSADFPQFELERLAQHAPPPRDFTRALCNAVADGRVGLVAEIKRASPSGGLIRDPFEPAELAQAYCAGEATCLSVLTDAPYFQGAPEHLRTARAACDLPTLRKDFIVHPWQVFESRCMGADCILLIMAALSDEQAHDLEGVARSLDMAVLAEVHDEHELDRALGLETRLIGINNRDLRTLDTDLTRTEELAPLIPADRIPVAESGIRTPEDVRRMAAAGARCILVGEHLLRQPDVAEAARALVGAL